ncbi:MAG: CPBP family intramembrane metalloprotease [Planctomycetaceae bacterium]|nr:CPBP family intramembrane metalloprotease [Planctomycetaceae bacterium]
MSFQNREDFLHTAGLFEFSLLVLGVALGWAFSVSSVEQIQWTLPATMWGILAGLALYLLITGLEHLPFDPLKSIQETVLEVIGRPLSQCSLIELALLSILAGIGEEVLFRGFLMTWIESWGGYWLGFGVSSFVFGLVHSVTWAYTFFATLAGGFLGWLFDATGQRNLLVPIIAHALYDFLAFIAIAKEARKMFGDEQSQKKSETDNEFEW